MTNSARNESPGGLSACARPVKPITICAGNSAIVEVMLAARASMPVSISAGSVMNEPPPASAFCAPAQSEARMSRIQRHPPLGARSDQAKSSRRRRVRRRSASSRSKSDRRAVDHPPAAGDHHPVGAMRAAQHQRRQRIVRAGKARLVEREQGKIRLAARPRACRCRRARGSAPSPRSPSAARRDG